MDKQKRRAAASAQPDPRKRVVATPSGASSAYGRELRFRFNRIDVGGAWCLTEITKDDHTALIAFMAEMEAKKLGEIIPGRCKRADVAADSKNSAAQKRARQQYPDDHDAIYELHIDGPRRLWGLLYEHEFSIIWWDPRHEVFPSKFVWENQN